MKLLDMFKDDATEQWSFSRISAALVVLACLGYAGWIVAQTRTLPDIPNGWLTYVITAYGLNKASSTWQSVSAYGQ